MIASQFSVLIIDDHALFRSGVKLIIGSEFQGVTVLEAGGVEEAMRESSSAPDLILLDVRLIGLNGLESLSLLRRRWPTGKVIMLSSDHSGRTVEQAFERGASGFISKADASDKLMTTIRAVLAQDHSVAALARSQAPQGPPSLRLTARQCEVLDYLHQGLPNKVIARKLNLSENTVRGHVQSLLVALDASSRSEAVFQAQRLGLLH